MCENARMKIKTKWMRLVGITLCVFVCVCLVRELFYKPKYSIGIALDEAQELSGHRYRVWGVSLVTNDLSPESFTNLSLLVVYETSEGVELDFNGAQRLVKIKRFNYGGINILRMVERFNTLRTGTNINVVEHIK
jgi:hypothetical protein